MLATPFSVVTVQMNLWLSVLEECKSVFFLSKKINNSEVELWILLLRFCCVFHKRSLSSLLGLRGFLKPFLSPAHSWLLCFVLASLLNVTLSLLLPSFRIQYSLNVADRLADEHVLIGLYVNMLRNNPPWLVQVWLLGCSLEEQSELVTSLSKGHRTCVTRRSQRHFSTLSGAFWDVSLNVGKVLRDQRIYVLIDIRSKGKT